MTTKTQHTPGPWMMTTENRGAIPQHFRPFVVTDETGSQVIARLPDGRGPTEIGNAALIAAAPALLRGCQAALAYLADPPSEFPENRQEAARIIRDALHAATKGTP